MYIILRSLNIPKALLVLEKNSVDTKEIIFLELVVYFTYE